MEARIDLELGDDTRAIRVVDDAFSGEVTMRDVHHKWSVVMTLDEARQLAEALQAAVAAGTQEI